MGAPANRRGPYRSRFRAQLPVGLALGLGVLLSVGSAGCCTVGVGVLLSVGSGVLVSVGLAVGVLLSVAVAQEAESSLSIRASHMPSGAAFQML